MEHNDRDRLLLAFANLATASPVGRRWPAARPDWPPS
jgi:hypothetical protein